MIKYPEYKYGQEVVLDKDYRNSSIVRVVRQSETNRMFTTVKTLDGKYEWDVMTNRLSPIEENGEQSG